MYLRNWMAETLIDDFLNCIKLKNKTQWYHCQKPLYGWIANTTSSGKRLWQMESYIDK